MARERRDDVVGLIPAAGTASRLGPIPCSKEVLPVGFTAAEDGERRRPKGAAEHLLGSMRSAGAGRALVVVRTGKWDVPTFLEAAGPSEPRRAYVVTGPTRGVPFTLEAAVPFLGGARVLFGFPDILFEPESALARVLDRQEEQGADLVLGLFPAARPEKMDMVDLGPEGEVRSVVVKPEETDLRHTWILAAWTPVFTRFLARWCRQRRAGDPAGPAASAEEPEELHLGHVVGSALDEGMDVDAVIVDGGGYVDIGTPEELASALADRAGRAAGERSREANPEPRDVVP